MDCFFRFNFPSISNGEQSRTQESCLDSHHLFDSSVFYFPFGYAKIPLFLKLIDT
jgi:hypothetical protein